MAKTLTTAAVERLKPLPGKKRRIIRDGASQSLFLVIQPSGHKSWMMRFRRPGGGIGKLVLGPLDRSARELTGEPEIGQPLTLAAARSLAAVVHRRRAMGRDVVADHKAAKYRRLAEIEESSDNAFATLARKFIDEHARRRTRRWQETARLLGFRYPADGGEPITIAGGLASRWGDKPIAQIDGHDLYQVVDEARRVGIPGLKQRRNGASDTQGRAMAAALSKLFSWLVEHRKIAVDPTLGMYKPPAPKARDRVLSDAEIKKFWKATDAVGEPFGALLKLLLLTGARLNEVAQMTRGELSDDLTTWSIPGSRTKNRRAHTLPLAPLSRDILRGVKPLADSDYVFTTTGTAPVSGFSKTKARLDAAMGVSDWRLHDLRRTAITGMARAGADLHVIERAVNHVSGSFGGVVGVYQQHRFADEVRAAMEAWGNLLTSIVEGRPANVTPIRQRRRS
jgi:integrase